MQKEILLLRAPKGDLKKTGQKGQKYTNFNIPMTQKLPVELRINFCQTTALVTKIRFNLEKKSTCKVCGEEQHNPIEILTTSVK